MFCAFMCKLGVARCGNHINAVTELTVPVYDTSISQYPICFEVTLCTSVYDIYRHLIGH